MKNPVVDAFKQTLSIVGIVTALIFAFFQLIRFQSPFAPLKSPIYLITGADRSTILIKAVIIFIGALLTNFFGNLWVISRK